MGWLRRILLLAVLVGSIAAPASALAQRSHTVRPGQSLARIARRYSVSVWDLALANRMRPEQTLRPGDVLTIPPQGVTYVRPGETLFRISRRYGIEVDKLKKMNKLPDDIIEVGQKLIVGTE